MKWYSTKEFWPGDEYNSNERFIRPEFYVVYHHGDFEMMTNLAFWDGSEFILGTTCHCDECDCACNYARSYSEECQVTHWMPLYLPAFAMGIYED